RRAHLVLQLIPPHRFVTNPFYCNGFRATARVQT
ncbi:MAG: hypothetical protein QG597_4519, partial [Actinomycetota bacterium]|nr:hypothetical protein [Actinomycetota bacterium]